MKYLSTRGECPPVSFLEAVATGLAPDGGLYLPETLPDISGYLAAWETLDYPGLCLAFFRLFATDLDKTALEACIRKAYTTFTNPKVAPLVKLDKDTSVLELFHGPTLAFKDFALQVLGGLYEEQIQRTGEGITVLGATSGDTGSAAIHGLLGRAGVQSIILYPYGRISPLQERQMACTGADNVFPVAIDGSFDDAQRLVKDLFGDLPFKRRYRLSAINSINLARILAQCVYYLYAWFQLEPEDRARVEFVVPTGNFGNVLAGWLCQRMGLPVSGFKVATNQNDILHRLFTSGDYRVTDVLPSLAPSMDIQVASNFERFLYYMVDGDTQRVRSIMHAVRHEGGYTFEDFDHTTFSASSTDDQGIMAIIRSVYQRYNIIVDPHTACGFSEQTPGVHRVILATAHPAKFPDTIEEAIGIHPTAPSLEALKHKPLVNHRMAADEGALRQFIERVAQV